MTYAKIHTWKDIFCFCLYYSCEFQKLSFYKHNAKAVILSIDSHEVCLIRRFILNTKNNVDGKGH